MLFLRRVWNRIWRGALFFLVLLLNLLLQDTILSHVQFGGVHPFFLPSLITAVALFEGGWRGGLFGIAAGVLSDLSGSSPSVFYTLLYPLIGFIVGTLTEFFINPKFYIYMLLAVLAVLITGVCQMFPLLLQSSSHFPLWGSCILQTLLGLPMIVLSYYTCQAVPRKLR